MHSLDLFPPESARPGVQALPLSLRGTGPTVDALYVHVPFCSTKCHYCDFYSVAGHLDRADAYLAALQREIDLHLALLGAVRPRTVFIGGGTPTLLSPELLACLLATLRERFDLSALEEFTVEANPNTFAPPTARVLAAGGVNRVSFGAQSFHLAELKMLQRDHDPDSVAQAFATARAAGIDNLNLDLIFGIPGQTPDSWNESLARALELNPSHMSCYSLTYEPSTAMTARLARGEFARLDEDTELQMFQSVYQRLHAAGFRRYETSNYARTAPCLHNLVYWKAGTWLGLGPSAGSHFVTRQDPAAAWQWKNVGSVTHYIDALAGADRVPITQLEGLPRAKWAGAAAVFWLRLDDGLSYAEFESCTGVNPAGILERVLRPFADMQLVELSPGRARITEKGVAVSNHMLARVLAAFESSSPAPR